MKKIIVSLSIIGAVAAVVIGATTAYFSDTETSTGNTLTAGTLDLKIDLGGTWKNPWTGPFFDAEDLKPGDQVEKTISLHVDNDAWLCAAIKPTGDWDNGCTEPEQEVDQTCGGVGSGELDNYLQVLIWSDEGQTLGWQRNDGIDNDNDGEFDETDEDQYEGDNKYQRNWEWVFYNGIYGEVKIPPTGEEGLPLKASEVTYTGVKACVGSISISGTGAGTVVTCDGSEVGNIIQGDSVTADAIFYAVQKENNPDFTCPSL